MSSTTNSTTRSQKKKRNRENYRKRKSDKPIEQSPFQRECVATPEEKTTPRPLEFSSHSSDIEADDLHLSVEDRVKNRYLTDEIVENDIETKETLANIGEQRHTNSLSYDDDSVINGIKTMFNDLKQEFIQRFDKIDNQLQNVERKFNRKFDQLSHKMDDIYERGAIPTILNRLRVDHNLETTYLPTNRMFHANYSKRSKDFFDQFEKFLHMNYSHIWTKKYELTFVSLKPQQIEFDVLGFGFECTSEKRPIIESPNIEPVHANSSNTFIKPFAANTIICAEVTTSTLTFDNDDLFILEKSISLNLINLEKQQPTYRLLNKLLQLERCVAFLLQYYKNIRLEHILVALFGRFDDSRHHHSPEYIYRAVFKSTFSTKVPLLNKLYESERDGKVKQLYFIC